MQHTRRASVARHAHFGGFFFVLSKMRSGDMKYTKPPLSLDQQADLLLSRGMAGDRDLMIERLSVVNYYRLSGYWHPFRMSGSDNLRTGTAFDSIWERYVFDRQLRLVVMDAVERIEVATRTRLSYTLTHLNADPFEYATEITALPGLMETHRDKFLKELRDTLTTNRELFVTHFKSKYGSDHSYMPVWMACEVMTFGCMLTLFRHSPADVKRDVASYFDVHDSVFQSWLLTLNTVRNICAHHARLWNRVIGTKPRIPKKDIVWHDPVEITNDRMFGVLTICKHCIDQIAPQSSWSDRFRRLLKAYPDMPIAGMGFPSDWEESDIWKR
jgi:abortive infection bacteriophage resistance protein